MKYLIDLTLIIEEKEAIFHEQTNREKMVTFFL